MSSGDSGQPPNPDHDTAPSHIAATYGVEQGVFMGMKGNGPGCPCDFGFPTDPNSNPNPNPASTSHTATRGVEREPRVGFKVSVEHSHPDPDPIHSPLAATYGVGQDGGMGVMGDNAPPPDPGPILNPTSTSAAISLWPHLYHVCS